MDLMYLLVGIIVLSLIWIIPSAAITFAIRFLIKRKLSKGWCILIAALIFLVGIIFESVLIGIHKPGTLDMIIRFACVSVVFIVLYDKNLPSIFDTEKELLNKRKNIKS